MNNIVFAKQLSDSSSDMIPHQLVLPPAEAEAAP